ncbi:MAG: metallophosphoesterase family protein [Anaerolineae bacterium]
MKILHTADWHLGKEWRGVDRTPDLENYVIPEIVDIALQNKVRLFVIAGDIFEGLNRDSLRQCASLLRRPFRALLEAGVHIALIPGNHDNLPLFRLLEAALDINPLSANARLVIFTEPSAQRFDGLQVLGVPYLTLASFRGWFAGQNAALPVESDLQNKTLTDLYERTIRSLKRNNLAPGAPALLVGHFAVSGASLRPGEDASERGYAGFETSYARDLSVNCEALLNNSQVPQYNALGHMHRGQKIPATSAPTLYSGAPDRFDRGEIDYQPSVLVVDLPDHGRAETTRVPIASATPFMKQTVASREDLIALASQLGGSARRVLGDLVISVSDLAAYPPLRDEAYELFPRLKQANTVRPQALNTSALEKFETSSDYTRVADYRAVFNEFFDTYSGEERTALARALGKIQEELKDED